MVYLLKMVIFYSYVKLPEGKFPNPIDPIKPINPNINPNIISYKLLLLAIIIDRKLLLSNTPIINPIVQYEQINSPQKIKDKSPNTGEHKK